MSSGRNDVRTQWAPEVTSCWTMVSCSAALKFWKLLTLTPTLHPSAQTGHQRHRDDKSHPCEDA
jgi:hypothetical protein